MPARAGFGQARAERVDTAGGSPWFDAILIDAGGGDVGHAAPGIVAKGKATTGGENVTGGIVGIAARGRAGE